MRLRIVFPGAKMTIKPQEISIAKSILRLSLAETFLGVAVIVGAVGGAVWQVTYFEEATRYESKLDLKQSEERQLTIMHQIQGQQIELRQLHMGDHAGVAQSMARLETAIGKLSDRVDALYNVVKSGYSSGAQLQETKFKGLKNENRHDGS